MACLIKALKSRAKKENKNLKKKRKKKTVFKILIKYEITR